MVKAALDPLVNKTLNIRLFHSVENVSDLRKKIMSGQLECCLVNPKLIVDPFQLVVAANKALTAKNRTTKTIFTEILFNLSVSKHITKSLQQFGITDDCRDLLVVTVGDDDSRVLSEIKGTEVELGALEEIRDLGAVKKAYKIGPEEGATSTIVDSVVSRIATKDFISH
ncbi:EKC/KEOPS complex subunit Tprkb [Tribolium castaneum]|uniref:EKC/KEOPS complex subunit Tprkb-like Protein n=1 Tax=Tribolium castaneum TaxID=7070 RepID=D6WXH9_TRICA|nr:PREDICTED: EKC/KEOPS complex subunit Tprkb [Tribolium castaneum]EFA08846.1 EKC/KEOPS complex subunit Tprkb-like Protein [Tribolium castaneum]|eukprot:XP_015838175.1 PREDICTED: EKC/KEOPS complex subunit Tprkb [Tribolium castaneum]